MITRLFLLAGLVAATALALALQDYLACAVLVPLYLIATHVLRLHERARSWRA